MKKLKMVSLVMVTSLALSVNAMGMTQSQCKNYSKPANSGTYVISINGSTFTYSSNGVIKTVVLSCDNKNTASINNSYQSNCYNNSTCKQEKNNNQNCQNNSIQENKEADKKSIKNSQNNGSNGNQNNSQNNNQNSNQNNSQNSNQNSNQNNSQNNNQNNNSNNSQNEVSDYAQAVVNLVNIERNKVGLAPLEVDTKVAVAAQIRAKEVINTFSHTRPDGSSCFTALSQSGATYRGAGENIARGQKTPEQVVKEWMVSSGHKANILNKNFKYIGVGVDGTAWVQLFTY